MAKKVIIVGGVAGGASAAARLRRVNEETEIIMFERGEYISFANCGLPYYIGGAITQREKLLVQSVSGMKNRFNIDIRIKTEILAIDPVKKKITARNLVTGKTYDESYDTLLLSPGASPIKPPIKGIEAAENLYTLRNIPDMDKIKAFVDQRSPKHAVVIGGGFIGLEMAENLIDRGVDVTLVEMSNQVLGPLDFEMAAAVQEHLVQKGVKVILNDGVSSFENQGKTVVLTSGTKIETNMVLLAIGVKPENRLAKEAGLEIGQRGGIVVNEYLQTSAPDVYAIGDAVQVSHYMNGEPVQIPLAWPANRQGRIVADTIMGKKTAYKGTLGTAIAKIFDLTAASTGLNEKQLMQAGVVYKTVHVHPSSHAGYYPGANAIALKMLFSPDDGKIYGAQAVGKDGVDKRIDVLATAIKGSLTIYDLPDLELSYAPPYSSAKDPVNMAGYAAVNILEGNVETIQWHEMEQMITNREEIIDVREPEEYEMGHIETAVNIPLSQLRDRMGEIKNKKVIIYCQAGLRGYIASRILVQNGFKPINLDGGYKTYSTAVMPFKRCTNETSDKIVFDVIVDARGLACPQPLIMLHNEIKSLGEGKSIKVQVTDNGFLRDIEKWCSSKGHTLLSYKEEKECMEAVICKGKTLTQPV
ncbi:CoA-disulfide reductase [Pseudalkalibacillus caeni]|uniref:CoA-disulfide reductase n=1 Tax=Exobacillus caeni TaxID=2574798 RepID=A0A5R9F6V4_9BACL|nr:CoA-disulfide reductase [Pseudalkalibacillus caeni]TLS38761.1 CoA-disulfide reductase [Pseudalkalibacillus caeni]